MNIFFVVSLTVLVELYRKDSDTVVLLRTFLASGSKKITWYTIMHIVIVFVSGLR